MGETEFRKDMGQRILVRRKALRMTQEELWIISNMIDYMNAKK